jgi:hypothetical protein
VSVPVDAACPSTFLVTPVICAGEVVNMSYFDSDIQTWTIVNVVLTGIPIKPLFIIWLVSLCLARRKNDHARVGFTWLKLVFPFYIL